MKKYLTLLASSVFTLLFVLSAVAASPIDWWAFDGDYFNVGSSGRNFDGNKSGHTFEETSSGKAIQFKGSEPHLSNLGRPAGDWTVVTRAKGKSGFNGRGTIWAMGQAASTYFLSMFCSDADGIGVLSKDTSNDQTYYVATKTGIEAADEAYHTYIMTFNWATKELTVYVDSLDEESKKTVTLPDWALTNLAFQFGSVHAGNGSTTLVSGSGICVDDFRVYNGILDQQTIESIFVSLDPQSASSCYMPSSEITTVSAMNTAISNAAADTYDFMLWDISTAKTIELDAVPTLPVRVIGSSTLTFSGVTDISTEKLAPFNFDNFSGTLAIETTANTTLTLSQDIILPAFAVTKATASEGEEHMLTITGNYTLKPYLLSLEEGTKLKIAEGATLGLQYYNRATQQSIVGKKIEVAGALIYTSSAEHTLGDLTGITGSGTIQFEVSRNESWVRFTQDKLFASTLSLVNNAQKADPNDAGLLLYNNDWNDKVFAIQNLSGSGDFRNDGDANTNGGAPVEITQTKDTEFSGRFWLNSTGNANNRKFFVTVKGEKTLTLSGQSSTQGELTVEGKVHLTGSWAGSVKVKAGGRLTGTGSISGTLAFEEGAIVELAEDLNLTTGTKLNLPTCHKIIDIASATFEKDGVTVEAEGLSSSAILEGEEGMYLAADNLIPHGLTRRMDISSGLQIEVYGTLLYEFTANKNFTSEETDFSGVTGTGTIHIKSNDRYFGFPSVDGKMFDARLSVINETGTGGILILNTSPQIEVANLSGPGQYRTDSGTAGTALLRTTLSKNNEISGIIKNSSNNKDQRHTKLIIASVNETPSMDCVLTLSAQNTSTAPLEIESTGTVNLTGKWSGDVVVNGVLIAGGTATVNTGAIGGDLSGTGTVYIPGGQKLVVSGTPSIGDLEFTTDENYQVFTTVSGTTTTYKALVPVAELDGVPYGTIEDAIATISDGGEEATIIDVIASPLEAVTIPANKNVALRVATEGIVFPSSIILNADATIIANVEVALATPSNGDTNLNLNGYVLTKQGAGTLKLSKTAITAGTINVAEGVLNFFAANDNSRCSITSNSQLVLATNGTEPITVAGQLYVQSGGSIKKMGSGEIRSTLTCYGNSCPVIVAEGTLTYNSWLNGSATVDADATLVLNDTRSGDVKVLPNGSSITVNGNLELKSGTLFGNIFGTGTTTVSDAFTLGSDLANDGTPGSIETDLIVSEEATLTLKVFSGTAIFEIPSLELNGTITPQYVYNASQGYTIKVIEKLSGKGTLASVTDSDSQITLVSNLELATGATFEPGIQTVSGTVALGNALTVKVGETIPAGAILSVSGGMSLTGNPTSTVIVNDEDKTAQYGLEVRDNSLYIVKKAVDFTLTYTGPVSLTAKVGDAEAADYTSDTALSVLPGTEIVFIPTYAATWYTKTVEGLTEATDGTFMVTVSAADAATLTVREITADTILPDTTTSAEAGVTMGAFATEGALKDDWKKAVAWAVENNLTPTDVNGMTFGDTYTTTEEAYLLDCAPADVATEKANFNVTDFYYNEDAREWVVEVAGETMTYKNGYITIRTSSDVDFTKNVLTEEQRFRKAVLLATPPASVED